MSAPTPAVFGRVLGRRLGGRYHVQSVVASGGMGAVFRALDERLGRAVAVKVLAMEDPAREAELRAWFQREARAAASLRHPNVVTVHDFGSDPALGIDYLVMELLPGRDVAGRMAEARGPLPAAEAIEIFREAGMGIAAGHRAGLVHRDVKPRNIFLVADPFGGWEVKLLDFGIAEAVASRAPAPLGSSGRPGPHTPRYAAPEQLRGDPVTPACDVYALAVTTLEMLTGRHPAELRTSDDEHAAARCVEKACAGNRAIRPAIADVLLRALHPDCTRRFGDAVGMLDALESALGTPYGVVRLDAEPGTAPRPASPGDATLHAPAGPHPPDADPTQPLGSARLDPDLGRPAAAPAGLVLPPNAAESKRAERRESSAADPPPRPRRGIAALLARFYGAALLIGLATTFAVVAARAGAGTAWNAAGRFFSSLSDGGSAEGGRSPVAQAEHERLAALGHEPGGPPLRFRAAAFGPRRAGAAREMVRELRRDGIRAGIADASLYPELEPGLEYVMIGPYPPSELLGMRERIAELEARYDAVFVIRSLPMPGPARR